MAAVKYLSIQEAADRLGVAHSTVWRWIARNKVEVEEIGGRKFLRESVVNREAKQRKGSQ